MYKIQLVENKKNHKGNFYAGYANHAGVELTFSSAKLAQEFINDNPDFFESFKAVFITVAVS